MISFTCRETWLHRVNPGMKLIVMTGLFVAVILIHNPNIMINITAGILLLLAIWSGHPGKRVLLYASPFLLIFVTSATGMMFFGQGETTWVHYGLVHITAESFYRGLHLGFRSLAMASAGLLFGLTTRPVHLFYALMQQWRMPPKYAYGFLAGMRMIPMIMEEFVIVRQALKVRGAGRRGIWGLFAMPRMIFIPLLAQSIRRAHRIAVAMQAKQFSADAGRTYYYAAGYSPYDLAFIAYFAGLLWLAHRSGILLPYFAIADVRL